MTFLRVAGKFKTILTKEQKRHVVVLFLMMVIAGFMEMLSVSLMLPFVKAVMQPEDIMQNPLVDRICELFNVQTGRSFLVFLSLVMAGIYLLKNIYLLFQIAMQNRFVNQTLFLTQRKLLNSFLHKPYESFLKIQSGEVLRIIGTDTVSAFGILTHILNLVTELVVTITLLITVIIISPILTIGMGALLAILIMGIQVIIRPILKKAGENHQSALAGMNKWMLQSVQGIKEIKIMGSERYFLHNFEKEGKVYVNSTYKQMTLGAIPKYLIEALTMGTFFIVVALQFLGGADADSIVPIISVIAMAAIRLLPAASRISGCMAGITFGEPAVDRLIENLKITQDEGVASDHKEDNDVKKTVLLSDSIEVKDVSYRYPTGDKAVFSEADMIIKKGTSVGIVGASGAGKTTAIDLVLGLLTPDQGRITVDGTDIQKFYKDWISQIGYIPQSIFLLDSDIRENVAFGVPADDIDDDKVWHALKEAALEEHVRSLPDGLFTEIGERGIRLSGGQRQRLGIARALYFDPEVIVFDEATSALDNDTENAIMESINHLQGSKTLIIIAHRLSTIENCDAVYCVEDGKIVRQR